MTGLRAWLLSFSPVTLLSAFSSVTLGSALAWYITGRFSWPLYLITLAGLLAAQAGINLIHDYVDYSTGVDVIYHSTGHTHRPHPVIDLGLSPNSIRAVGYALDALALAAAAYLAIVVGLPVVVLGLIGVFLGVEYSEPPLKLHYRGLGELDAAIAMGPLVTWGSYVVQVGARGLVQPFPLLVGVPNGVYTFLILLGSGALEVEACRAVGKKTVVVAVGMKGVRRVTIAAIAIMFSAIVASALLGYLPLISLVALALLPWTLRLASPLLSGAEEEVRRRWVELRRLWAGPFSVRIIMLVLFIASMILTRLLLLPRALL